MKVFVCLLLLCPALLVAADIIVCKGNTESQNSCLNGGTCISTESFPYFQCICTPPFTGVTCSDVIKRNHKRSNVNRELSTFIIAVIVVLTIAVILATLIILFWKGVHPYIKDKIHYRKKATEALMTNEEQKHSSEDEL